MSCLDLIVLVARAIRLGTEVLYIYILIPRFIIIFFLLLLPARMTAIYRYLR